MLDPVLVATSGDALGDDSVVSALLELLCPRVVLITPNLAEAARLAGGRFRGDDVDIADTARRLRAGGDAAWLVKGGHGTGRTATDILVDTDGTAHFASPRQITRNTHGTGCTLSAAIAAQLAHGRTLREAVSDAKAYLDKALAGADRLAVGHGHGPVDHFAGWREA